MIPIRERESFGSYLRKEEKGRFSTFPEMTVEMKEEKERRWQQ